MEFRAAVDAGDVLLARHAGTVERVVSDRITVRREGGELDEYYLRKFARSNQGTCVNQRPLVEGEHLQAGTVMADGSSTDQGELSSRQEPARGFHALGGVQLRGRHYHLRAHRQGRYPLLHSHRGVRGAGSRHQAWARGDNPRHPQRLRRRPDEPGCRRHHPHRCRGRSGDVLVGKVTPKGESEPTPQEKLLRAIRGEGAGG